MIKDQFDRSVAEALDQIPEIFRRKMENVEVIVEDFPDQETLHSLDLDSKWDLLGLYVGVPVTHQSFFSVNVLPDRIYLYRRPIVRSAGRPEKIPTVIRDVVIHELGHHLGFDDEELYAMTGEET
ncbi:MAG: metallopeptidase family protein [Desulfomonilaceae bacterium]|nr:metallopeptidase family protein [Desulfomonilaceae bacterium]